MGQDSNQPIKARDVAQPVLEKYENDTELYEQVRGRAVMMKQWIETQNASDVQGYKLPGEKSHWSHSAITGAALIFTAYNWQLPFFITLYVIGAATAIGIPILKTKPSGSKLKNLKTHAVHDIKKYPIPYIASGVIVALAFKSTGHNFPEGSVTFLDAAVSALKIHFGL